MRISLGCDHAGFELKEMVNNWLRGWNHDVIDVGAHKFDPSDDYPDFAATAAQSVQEGSVDRAIIICGSGVGASIVANKFQGVRAAMCHDTYSAHQGVEHDDMNVLCLGSRIIGYELAREIVSAFTEAVFSNDERHLRRLQKVKQIEEGNQKP